MYEKEYLNKNLISGTDEQFFNSFKNDWIGDDFVEQLEWAMLMTRTSNFQSIKAGNHLIPTTRNSFDKAFLMTGSLKDNLQFIKPLSGYQANPEMFPLLNMKVMGIGDQINLIKLKELTISDKSLLKVKNKYAFELTEAIYRKQDEEFYCTKHGYSFKHKFFDNDMSAWENLKERFDALNEKYCIGNPDKFKKKYPEAIPAGKGWTLPEEHPDMIYYRNEHKAIKDAIANFEHIDPHPFSLVPGYEVILNGWHEDRELIYEIFRKVAMIYQVALTMYYEWSIYIKEEGNIGFVIPVDPYILKDMYHTSMLKFDSGKRMLHFVRDHYRRKQADGNADYSIYIQKYLRGEHNFSYNGFSVSIIPPRYDLNRAKTRKQFIDPIQNTIKKKLKK
jgi:hypothetical protein